MTHDCSSLVKAIDAYIEKADNDLKEALNDAGFLEAADTVDTIAALERRVSEALVVETERFKAATEKAVDLDSFAADIWPGVKSEDDVDKQLEDIFLDEFSVNMPKLATSYVKSIDSELTVKAISKRTAAWSESWSHELGKIMKLTSHDQLERILTKGLKDGQSVADFTRAFLDSGIRNEYYRARTVAVTEVLTAHSAAAQEAFMQSPAVAAKAWRHTGSYRNEPRENHVAINGQQVSTKEAFTLTGADGGTYYPIFPRDPTALPVGERANCHCIVQPVVLADVLGLPIEERRRLQEEAIAEDDGEWEKELDAKNKAKAGIE